MIDYKALLTKYMNMVIKEEGATFVMYARTYNFDKEEIQELERLEKLAINNYNELLELPPQIDENKD